MPAEAYDRFMGRYSRQLGLQMISLAGVRAGHTALDVGCGPGVLTGELVALLGAEAVNAIDPSESFVEATRGRYPGVDVRRASAEALPFADDRFDVAIAQLVVHFMEDPVAGLAEMRRVVRRGGAVAACVWDHAGGHSPIATLWRVVATIDPGARDEADLAGAREGHLAHLFQDAGLDDIRAAEVSAEVEYSTFDAWWEPFLLGVGPAGQYVHSLDERRRQELSDACRELLGPPPFRITAHAWAVAATVE